MITTSGAVAHVKKAYYFMEELSTKDNTLYRSTKRSIQEIVDICKDIIEIGEDILDDDTPRGKPRKQDNSSTYADLQNKSSDNDRISQLEEKVKGMSSDLSNISKFIEKLSDRLLDNVSSNQHELETKEVLKDDISSDNNEKRAENRRWISKFDSGFSAMELSISKDENIHPDTKNVGQRIVDWYRTRILDLDVTKCDFRYHVSNIMEYVRAIVFDFARSDDKRRWCSLFDSWLNKVKSNDPSVSRYALPYDVFNTYTETSDDSYCATSEEALLWSDVVEHDMHECSSYDLKKYYAYRFKDGEGNPIKVSDYRRLQQTC